MKPLLDIPAFLQALFVFYPGPENTYLTIPARQKYKAEFLHHFMKALVVEGTDHVQPIRVSISTHGRNKADDTIKKLLQEFNGFLGIHLKHNVPIIMELSSSTFWHYDKWTSQQKHFLYHIQNKTPIFKVQADQILLTLQAAHEQFLLNQKMQNIPVLEHAGSLHKKL